MYNFWLKPSASTFFIVNHRFGFFCFKEIHLILQNIHP